MDTYLAITIGPIYKTMLLARKTRELWSASFTFSRLMKHLIAAFGKHGQLISPGLNVTEPLHGAGVFPDRCFFKINGSPLTEQQIGETKKAAFTQFADETGLENVAAYYQVYIVQSGLQENPVSHLNQMLDALELQQNYSAKETVNWNQVWKNGGYFQRLYRKGFDPEDNLLPDLLLKNGKAIRRFPSIIEISTNEFARQSPDKYWSSIGYQYLKKSNPVDPFGRGDTATLIDEADNEDLILNKVKNAFPEQFLFRHRYFSVVNADGDSVGALIKKIETEHGDLHKLSMLLNSFTEKAAELIVQYGAFPIYMGGDDLLFFAPLANASLSENFAYQSKTAHGSIFGNNLFFLLSKLNAVFQETLQPLTTQYGIDVSLSFGVMCGYYKQPLREISQAAYNNLFSKAKEQPGKNYIALQVQKHSGQSFQFGFRQEGELYEAFLKLAEATANKEVVFLNSVMYKLDDQKSILEEIGAHAARLTLFFEANFNESGHELNQGFFTALVSLIQGVFTEWASLSLQAKMEKIYGALRFVHFINAKDVDD